MTRIRTVLITGLLCAAVNSAWATRPLTIDDADPTPVGQAQLISGLSVEHTDAHQDWDYPFGIAYGLASNLEINASLGAEHAAVEAINGSAAQNAGFGDTRIGLKWLFLDETE